jgi:hypothetical protein
LRNFWSNRHYDRPRGVRAAQPTAWVPGSKPIWLSEYGAPAIDKAGNGPNVFVDAKSSESAAPPCSSRTRDDVAQRRAIEATLLHYAPGSAANPRAEAYDGFMIDLARSCAWCWDARPYPAFPARADVWADWPSYELGHWLNGRLGTGNLADVVAEICGRAGIVDVDVSRLFGIVAGYAVDARSTSADALAALMDAYCFAAVDRDGRLTFLPSSARIDARLTSEDLCAAPQLEVMTPAPGARAVQARVRYIDPAADYRLAVRVAQGPEGAGGGSLSVDVPLALDAAQADAIGRARLAREARTRLTFAVSPTRLDLETGDVLDVSTETVSGAFRILRIEERGVRVIEAEAITDGGAPAGRAAAAAAAGEVLLPPDPAVIVLDVPPLPGSEEDSRPLAAVTLAPWRPIDLSVGPDPATAAFAARAPGPAKVGVLEWALWPGPVGRFDLGNRVRRRFPVGTALASASRRAVLDGANLFAVEQAPSVWEILAIADLTLVGPGLYDASTFLRGLQGTETAMTGPAPAGSRIVALDASLARLDVRSDWEGSGLSVFAAAAGLDATTAVRGVALTGARRWARPFAPAHPRARALADGTIRLSWVRRSRIGGDGWAGAEVPLAEETERYRIDILKNGAVVRTAEAQEPALLYAPSDQVADFGWRPSWLAWCVAHISGTAGAGGVRESSGPL